MPSVLLTQSFSISHHSSFASYCIICFFVTASFVWVAVSNVQAVRWNRSSSTKLRRCGEREPRPPRLVTVGTVVRFPSDQRQAGRLSNGCHLNLACPLNIKAETRHLLTSHSITLTSSTVGRRYNMKPPGKTG